MLKLLKDLHGKGASKHLIRKQSLHQPHTYKAGLVTIFRDLFN